MSFRWHNLTKVGPQLWAASPGWSVWVLAAMLLEVGFGLGVLYAIKRLVDSVSSMLSAGSLDGAAGDALVLVGLAGGLTLALLIARSLASLAREAQGLEVADYLDEKIHSKAIGVDLAFYESPRYFDTLRRARQYGTRRPAQVTSNLVGLVRNTMMLLAISALILTINWLLLPLLLLVIVPALLVRLYFTRYLYDWQRERTQAERRAGYLDWLLTTDRNAKEMRLAGLGRYLKSLHRSLRGSIRLQRMGIGRRRTVSELLFALIGSTAFFVSLAYLTMQTAGGNNSVGDLVLFLLIFQRAQSMGQEVVQQVSSLYEDHLYLGFLFEFLSIEPDVVSPAMPKPVPGSLVRGVVMEAVSFTYPGSTRPALTDISLELPPGEITAVVGANGSGKTSLVKLLCRLYDPTAGKVLLDGVDIREFDLADYRNLFGVLFQDYGKYADTVSENIRYGDATLPADADVIQEAARQSGADVFIRELAGGFGTRLTRMFDQGHEISIGQWQRIALARAMVHPARYLVLDEPSSNLDPQAEYELFRDLRQILGKRGALIISHRLSTVRQASRIYVLEQGRVAESGSHDELMGVDGLYRGMFEQQAGGYRSD